MRAADALVEGLRRHGADRVFCVPGESYLALLDALHGDALHGEGAIDVVVCRHEGGAGLMAVADAKLTGRPGVVAVSRGPGASNAAIALHLAEQDAVPLVALIGQVARHERHRGAFQEVDYAAFLGPICKHVEEVHDPDRLGEALARAFHAARGGTPGPVALALPEDMLEAAVSAPVPGPHPVAVPGPDAGAVAEAAAMLAASKRPLIVAGGGMASPTGRAALARLAQAAAAPVALSFKYQHLLDNASPLYAGHLGFKIPPAQVEALARADLVLAIGTRLGDTPTQGWRFPRAPEPAQPLIHVWPDPGVIGRVFRPALGLACDPVRFAEALAGEASAQGREEGWAASLHAITGRLAGWQVREMPDGLDFGAAVRAIRERAPRDAIVCTDSGNFSSWVHMGWPWDGTQPAIGSVGGAMGLGVPGAVAASLRHPGRCVLGFVGDGGAMMTGAELATGIAHGATPKIVVSANGTYGTIRLHQEKAYPGRVAGTALANPDFAAWGASFGALGLRVGKGDDVEEAAARLLAHEGAAVLAVESSAEAITALTTIEALRGG